MLQTFIPNYLSTLNYNILTYPKKHWSYRRKWFCIIKRHLQVTVITGIIISLSQHHLQGCRCRILPPAFFKYQNCKIAYRPKVTATLCSGLDMGMSAPLPVWKRIINFEVGGSTDLRMVALVFSFVRVILFAFLLTLSFSHWKMLW